ncbi:MAG: BrnA antitoxin family protein [Caldilineaceae bacterium]|nr:BrnA antitoxin family protein [Caldilineaceae bacterium]HRJ40614.1 BrnA antitoxin family protein [Caldilineaceae bacterium]
MNKDSSSQISDEWDEYPELTQADFDRATFRIGLKPVQRKQGVAIVLDATIVEYFRGLAGEGDYQSRINDTLREAVLGLNLEERLRRIIREEIRSAN